jgi:hypothetical protein
MCFMSLNFISIVVVVPNQENMDLAEFRLHSRYTLHRQGQAMNGAVEDFGSQPNHNFFSINVGQSMVFDFGRGDRRQF